MRSTQTQPDVVVDFTIPDTVFDNARLCLEHGTHVVVGTTGITDEQLDELRASWPSARRRNCLIAPNFAIGAVLMMEASKLIAPHMPDCEIVELHHEAEARRAVGHRQAHGRADRRGRRAQATCRSTACGYPAWSPTRK